MKKRRLCDLSVMLLLVMIMLVSGCAKKEKGAQDIKIVTSENPTEEKTDEKKEEPEEEEAVKKGILVALDPGHQGPNVDMSAKEPNAPDSSEMKTKATTGTEGEYSGIAEYQLVLDISLAVRDELEAQGYDVIMTREDNDTAISNAQRATMANEAGADVMVRVHANSSEDHSASGALALTSSKDNPYVGNLYEKSTKLANSILDSYCQSTGMKNTGIQENDTMTGINWSKIPVMILEMGFMSNKKDDMNMADETYRKQMVQGIVDGINQYFGQEGVRQGTTEKKDKELQELLQNAIQSRIDMGEKWSVYAKNLTTGAYASVSEQQMESASVIKLYTAGAVYENLEIVKAGESQDGETDKLLKSMITQSDNDSANTLVERLGNGDVSAGMKKVNAFCNAHGYAGTHMGRLMLQPNDQDDNYTTVEDCGALLQDIYENQLEGSEIILSYMKAQERTAKIPAGLPEGVTSANKTGELDDVENDVAIVEADGTTYILCVMSNKDSEPQSARDEIVKISSEVYQHFLQ